MCGTYLLRRSKSRCSKRFHASTPVESTPHALCPDHAILFRRKQAPWRLAASTARQPHSTLVPSHGKRPAAIWLSLPEWLPRRVWGVSAALTDRAEPPCSLEEAPASIQTASVNGGGAPVCGRWHGWHGDEPRGSGATWQAAGKLSGPHGTCGRPWDWPRSDLDLADSRWALRRIVQAVRMS